MILKITTLVVLLLAVAAQTDIDEGTIRLQRLRERSLQSSNRIMTFNRQDFEEFVMKYPRPYDVVIYFTARTCKFCEYIS
jgi:thioredoxin-like negative regulator of GroEL